MKYEIVMRMSIDEFFNYIREIQYGYKDENGRLHIWGENDFFDYKYSYSIPEEVVRNNCAWCWDICMLIKKYFEAHECCACTYYFEYLDKEKGYHKTHTPCYARIDGEWFECPDNSANFKFGDRRSKNIQKLIENSSRDFFDCWCRQCFGEIYDKNKLVKKFDICFKSGVTDEEFMESIRRYS